MTDHEPIDLPGAVDDIDALPEHFRPAYKQGEDGKWRPNVRATEDGWAFQNVAGLRKALESEKAERRKAKAAAQQFEGLAERLEGLDIDEVVETYNRVREGKLTDAEQVSKMRESLKKQSDERYNTQREEYEAKVQSLVKQLVRDKVEGEAAKAFASCGGDAFALMPHLRDACEVREIDGEYRAVVLNKDGEPRISNREAGDLMTVEEYVTEEMRGDPRLERYFGNATGGGATERFGGSRMGTPASRAKPGLDRLQAARAAQQRGR